MRKVFLSTMLLAPMRPAKFYSDDFEISENSYQFPLTYIIENDVADGDEVVVITVLQANESGFNRSHENCEVYKADIKRALAAKKNLKLQFIDVETRKEFTSGTFHRFFKEVAKLIHNEDKLYMDITFGQKPYSFSMFIAGAYAVKACKNTEIEAVIYAQKYTGDVEQQENEPSKIYDLTGLFYLNEMAGETNSGDKECMDQLLDFIIKD